MSKEKKPAFASAVEMLSRQEYSKSRLKDKLLKKDYDEKEAEEALKRLEELRLLNDKEAVQSRFRFMYENGRSSLKEIKYKLMRQGFLREDIEDAAPEDTRERELSAAFRSLKIKFRRNKDTLKMKGYLYRHGFDADISREAVEKFLEE